MGSSKYPLVITVVCSKGAALCRLCGPLCCSRAEYCGHAARWGWSPACLEAAGPLAGRPGPGTDGCLP